GRLGCRLDGGLRRGRADDTGGHDSAAGQEGQGQAGTDCSFGWQDGLLYFCVDGWTAARIAATEASTMRFTPSWPSSAVDRVGSPCTPPPLPALAPAASSAVRTSVGSRASDRL